MPTDPAQDSGKPLKSADAEMYGTATLLGDDAEMSDVDFAFEAQAEAAMADG